MEKMMRSSKRGCDGLPAYRLANLFMCECQKDIVNSFWRSYRMVIADLDLQLSKLPSIYAQDGKGMQSIVYAHYFCGSTDIFVTESDGELLYGYFILNGDYDNAEFGYVSLLEVTSMKLLNLDFYWEPCKLSDALNRVDTEYFPCE